MPGDPELPHTLPSGSPWPDEAGALKVKTQFNLDTQRGQEAYSDVVFFGEQQEWSIGYQVPTGAATIKDGVRDIKTLNLYEYSPVLFGAMPAARSLAGVKSAQLAFKALADLEVPDLPELDDADEEVTDEALEDVIDVSEEFAEFEEDDDGEEDNDFEDDDDDEDEGDDDGEDDIALDSSQSGAVAAAIDALEGVSEEKAGRIISSVNLKLIQQAQAALSAILTAAEGTGAPKTEKKVRGTSTDDPGTGEDAPIDEGDGQDYESVSEVIADKLEQSNIDQQSLAKLQWLAKEFDDPDEDDMPEDRKNIAAVFLDEIENAIENAVDDATANALKDVAGVFAKLTADDPDLNSMPGGDATSQDDTQTKDAPGGLEEKVVFDLAELEAFTLDEVD
jgi:hypothetical protein